MAVQGPIPVEFGQVFPRGVFAAGTFEPVRDFEASKGGRFVQSKDKASGLPLWLVDVIDADPTARDKTARIKVAATDQPVLPAAAAGMPFVPVEFTGLTVTPVRQPGRAAGLLPQGDRGAGARSRRSGQWLGWGRGGVMSKAGRQERQFLPPQCLPRSANSERS